MSKILISGSWRYEDKKLELLVRKTVGDILNKGDEIISGGALGVDYFVLDEVLKLKQATRVQVFLPSSLNFYRKHYLKRAEEGIITKLEAHNLITQLKELKKFNKASLIETREVMNLNQAAYFARNSKEVANADRLIAFQVNQSGGTQDTIEKARRKGISVQVHQFTL